MTRQYQRYDKEELQLFVIDSMSYTEVCRKMGKHPVGGTITNIKLMCERYGIDVSHMTGQGHGKGKRSMKRLSPDERLVMGTPTDHRMIAHKLRTALFELGIVHECNKCGINEWNGESLVLEIDHIDGQYWNNRQENLQFLCPNCHSQKK